MAVLADNGGLPEIDGDGAADGNGAIGSDRARGQVRQVLLRPCHLRVQQDTTGLDPDKRSSTLVFCLHRLEAVKDEAVAGQEHHSLGRHRDVDGVYLRHSYYSLLSLSKAAVFAGHGGT